MATGFYGPVFIVGMPRSGTKLMRALLNQHPRINLTLAESHFIPYSLKKFGDPPPFRSREDLTPFMRGLQQTAFFSTMSKAGYTLDQSTFLQNVDYTTWSAIFEHVFRHFGSKRATIDTIWGDKTPGYINHMPLLKAVFPNAKFLHVIRDHRDYCLSVRKSFAKSVYRAAVRWLNLASAPEDLGDAKGHSTILTNNKNKYLTQLSSQEIKRIEEIVCDVAKSVGYRLENNVVHRSLNSLTLRILKLHDGVASLIHHIKAERDLTKGVMRLFHHYTKSSWRTAKTSWMRWDNPRG